jgi:hypothetical protein
MEPPRQEAAVWRNSKAQQCLRQLVASGEIDMILTPKQVWDRFCIPRPEFSGFHYNNKIFPSRLRAIQKQHVEKSRRAEDSSAALAHDRLLLPAPAHNHRGEPRWQGSEAERFLKLDVAENRHQLMKPRQLYDSRVVYHSNYPLEVFRKHIHQEIRLRKLLDQYKIRK